MAEKHFSEQEKHTRDYLLPYLLKYIPDLARYKVLEIGCAEGGFLNQLIRYGIEASGVELESSRVKTARRLVPGIPIQIGDITDPVINSLVGSDFDLIVMRDVIEHIPDREMTFTNLSGLLKNNGFLYITFPPKYSAFAGHQQNARSIIKRLPFFHLLPRTLIQKIGLRLKEDPLLIEEVISNYRSGLTLKEFEKLCTRYGFEIRVKELFFSRPVFKTRFGWPIIRFPAFPFIREFLASGCECLLQKK